VTTDRYSRPIGRLSQCAANGARSSLATITFLGEQQDITDSDPELSDTYLTEYIAPRRRSVWDALRPRDNAGRTSLRHRPCLHLGPVDWAPLLSSARPRRAARARHGRANGRRCPRGLRCEREHESDRPVGAADSGQVQGCPRTSPGRRDTSHNGDSPGRVVYPIRAVVSQTTPSRRKKMTQVLPPRNGCMTSPESWSRSLHRWSCTRRAHHSRIRSVVGR